MEDELILSEKDIAKLDGIVQKMISRGDKKEVIQLVVNDFKSIYGVKKKESDTPSPSTPSRAKMESTVAPSVGRGVENRMPSTSVSKPIKSEGARLGIDKNQIYNNAAVELVRENIQGGYITEEEVASLSTTPDKLFNTIADRRTQEALKFRSKSPEEEAIEAARQNWERRGGAPVSLKGKSVDPFAPQARATEKKFEDIVRERQTAEVNAGLQTQAKRQILELIPEDKRNDKEYLKKVEKDLFVNQGIALDLSGDKRYNDQNIFKDFIYSLGEGVGALDYGIRSAVGIEIDHFGLPLEASRQLQKKAFNLNTTKFEQDFYDALTDGDFSNAARVALNTTAQSAPLMGIAAAANFAGGPAASYATMATLSAAQSYGDVKNEEWFKDLSDVEKLGYVSAAGASEAVGEFVGGRVLTRAMRGIMEAGGEAAAKKTFSEYFKGLIKGGAVNLTEESLGEAFTGASQYVIDNVAKGEEITANGIIDAAVRSGAAGLGMAGVMTAGGASVSTPIYLANKIGSNFEIKKINEALKVKREALLKAETPEERYILAQDVLDLTKRRDGQVKSDVKFFENMTSADQAKVFALNNELENMAETRRSSENDEVKDSLKNRMLQTYEQIKEIQNKYKYDTLEKGEVPSAEQRGATPVQVQPVAGTSQEAPQAGGVLQEAVEEVVTDADKIANRVDAIPVFQAMAESQEVDIKDADAAQEQIIQAIDEIQTLDIADDEKQVYTDILTEKFNEIDYYDNKTAITTEEVTQATPVGAPRRTLKEVPAQEGKLTLKERVNNAPVSTGTEGAGERSYVEAQEDGTLDVVTYKRQRGKGVQEVRREKGVFPNYESIEYVDSSFDEFGNLDGVVVRSATPAGTDVSERTITIRNRSEKSATQKAEGTDLNLALDLAIEAKIRQLGSIPQYEFDQAYEKVSKKVEKKTKVPAKPRPVIETKEEAAAARDIEVIGIGIKSKRVSAKTAEVLNRYLSTLYSVLPDVKMVLHFNQESLNQSLEQPPQAEIEGYYDAKNKEIHVLVTPDTDGQISKNELRVIRHEIIHPILDALVKEDAGFTFRASRVIMDIMDTLPEELSRSAAARRIRQYINSGQTEELVVEFVAQFSNPELYNQIKPESNTFTKIRNFVNDILKFFGIDTKLTNKREVFDFLSRMNQAFEVGQSIKVKTTGPLASATKKLKFSIGKPEAEQFVRRFMSGPNFSDIVPPGDIIEFDSAESSLSNNVLNALPVLNSLSKKLNVPLVFVNKNKNKNYQFTSKVAFLDDLVEDYNLNYTSQVIDKLKTLGYKIDDTNKTNKVVFINSNASSADQAIYAYSSLFLDAVKQRNKQFFSSIVDRVITGKNIEGDNLMMIARTSYETLLEEAIAKNLSKRNAKDIDLANVDNVINKETKSQLAYIAISDAISDFALSYTDEEVNNNRVVKEIVNESVKDLNEQLDKTPLSIEDFSVKSRLDDLSQLITSNTEISSLSKSAYETVIDLARKIVAKKYTVSDNLQNIKDKVSDYISLIASVSDVITYDSVLKKMSPSLMSSVMRSVKLTPLEDDIKKVILYATELDNKISDIEFDTLEEIHDLKAKALNEILEAFAQSKIVDYISASGGKIENAFYALYPISQLPKEKRTLMLKIIMGYSKLNSKYIDGYEEFISRSIDTAMGLEAVPIIVGGYGNFFVYYIRASADSEISVSGIDTYTKENQKYSYESSDFSEANYRVYDDFNKLKSDGSEREQTDANAIQQFNMVMTNTVQEFSLTARSSVKLDSYSDSFDSSTFAEQIYEKIASALGVDIENSHDATYMASTLYKGNPNAPNISYIQTNTNLDKDKLLTNIFESKVAQYISDEIDNQTAQDDTASLEQAIKDKVITYRDVINLGYEYKNQLSQRREYTFDVNWVVPELYKGLDVIPKSLKGTILKDKYKIGATYNRTSGTIYVEFSSSVFMYSNVPPFLDTFSNFQKVVAAIPTMFPDVEYAAVTFSAASEDTSHPLFQEFINNLNHIARNGTEAEKIEANKIRNESLRFDESSNFRRRMLYNKAYERAMGGSFSLKSGSELAMYIDGVGVYAFDASVQKGQAESDYEKFKRASYGGGTPEQIESKYNGRLLINDEEARKQDPSLASADSFDVERVLTRFAEKFNAFSNVGEVLPIPTVLRNLNQETIYTKSAVKFSQRLKLDPAEESAEDKALDKVAQASFDADKEYAERMSAFKKIQKTILSKQAWTDRQNEVREAMIEGGLDFAENMMTVRAGAFANATYKFENAEKIIYGGLSLADIELLDQVIFMRRVIQIDSNWDKRKEDAQNKYAAAVTSYNEVKKTADTLIREERKKANPDKKAIAYLENDVIIAEKRVQELRDRVDQYAVRPKHPKGLSAEDCIQAMAALQRKVGNRKFESVLNLRADLYFNQFRDVLRDYEQYGLIDKDTLERFINDDYEPRKFIEKIFDNLDNEVFQRAGAGLKQDVLKAIEDGSEGNLLMDSRMLLSFALKAAESKRFENISNAELAKGATPDNAIWLRPSNKKVLSNGEVATDKYGNQIIEPADKGFTNLFYKEGGKLRAVQLRNDLYVQWQDLNKSFSGLSGNFKKVLATLSGAPLLRIFATGYNPLFGIGLAVPESLAVVMARGKVYGKDTLLPIALMKMAKDYGIGIYSKVKDTELLRDYFAHGGGMSFMSQEFRPEYRFQQKYRNSLEFSLAKKWDSVTKGIAFTGEAFEIGIRLAVYRRMIENLKQQFPDLAKTTEGIDKIKFMAAAEARDIVDFSKGGTLAKDLDTIMPYFNVAIQAVASTFKGIKDNPEKFAVKFAQYSAGLMGLVFANILVYGDDEYEDIDPYIRHRYHVLLLPTMGKDGKRQYIRIKKVQQLVPLTTPIETLARSWASYLATGKEKKFSEDEIKAMWDNMAEGVPVFIPGIDKAQDILTRIPAYDMIAKAFFNYDSFRNATIVPEQYFGKIKPYAEGRADDKTEFFYKAIAKASESEFIPDISAPRLKAGTESLITSPTTNFLVGIAYGFTDMSTRAGAAILDVEDVSMSPNQKEKKMESIISDEFSRIMEAPKKIFIREVNPKWRDYVRKGSKAEEIVLEEGTEDYVASESIKALARKEKETGKRDVEAIKKVLNSIPEPKRERIARKYMYELARTDEQRSMLSIRYADSQAMAARLFFEKFGRLEGEELNQAVEDLKGVGFRPGDEFYGTLRTLYNKE